MILKGSQRGGAGALAKHLLRTDENEHVTVEQLRGFVSDNLSDALAEAEAIAKGKVFSVSRYTGIKRKDLEGRLGSPRNLLTLDALRTDSMLVPTTVELEALREQRRRHRRELTPLKWARRKIVRAQRIERAQAVQRHQKRRGTTKTSRVPGALKLPRHLSAHTVPQLAASLSRVACCLGESSPVDLVGPVLLAFWNVLYSVGVSQSAFHFKIATFRRPAPDLTLPPTSIQRDGDSGGWFGRSGRGERRGLVRSLALSAAPDPVAG